MPMPDEEQESKSLIAAETIADEGPAEPIAGPNWQRREFQVNEQMREVCRMGVKLAEAEITALRKRLKKLQYGA